MNELDENDVNLDVRIDPISQAIGVETAFDLKTGNIIDVNSKEIVVSKQQIYTNNDFVNEVVEYENDDDDDDENTNDDEYVAKLESEKYVKDNYKRLIDKSMDAVDELLELARMTDKPSAYEQASNFLRTIADINEKLLGIDERKESNSIKMKLSNKKGSGEIINNTQNNTVICSDPADILKALGSRSS